MRPHSRSATLRPKPNAENQIELASILAVDRKTIQRHRKIPADRLAEYNNGLVGKWTIPARVGRDYLKQMTAEVREEIEDSRGRFRYVWVQKLRDNHSTAS